MAGGVARLGLFQNRSRKSRDSTPNQKIQSRKSRDSTPTEVAATSDLRLTALKELSIQERVWKLRWHFVHAGLRGRAGLTTLKWLSFRRSRRDSGPLFWWWKKKSFLSRPLTRNDQRWGHFCLQQHRRRIPFLLYLLNATPVYLAWTWKTQITMKKMPI